MPSTGYRAPTFHDGKTSGLPRVLVTRAAHQASALGDALAAHGLLVVSIPTIAIEPPSDEYASLHQAMAQLDEYDWIAFTSANAVAVFAEQREELGVDEVPCRIASIGAATTRAIHDAGLSVDLQPDTAVAEELVRVLRPRVAGGNVLLVRAESARDVLPVKLEAAGARVAIATAYRTVVPFESVALLRAELPAIAAITLASSSAVRNLLELCDAAGMTLPEGVVLASIGPVTSATLREYGYSPTIEASAAQVEVLASELAHFFRDCGTRVP